MPKPRSVHEGALREISANMLVDPLDRSTFADPEHVLADGNAVNFLYGASVGAFILLVQAEIVAAQALLATGSRDPDICEVPSDVRQSIARCWLTYFHEAI
jgi:hypothetical protein